MDIDMVKNSANQGGRWRALFGWLGAVTGLAGAVAAPAGTTPAVAQRSDYRAAASAPEAWQAFAKQLQGRFQQRLASDDDAAQRFHAQLQERSGPEPVAIIVRSWILPDGRVERVDFDGIDKAAALNLRALLTRDNVGAPPPDMLQPLHLRLTLRPNDHPAQGK